MAERWNSRLSDLLAHELSKPSDIYAGETSTFFLNTFCCDF
jgi:hypothetical protein